MTVHILVSLLILLFLAWRLRKLAAARHPAARVGWVPLAWMILLLLPLSFGPIVPISHFVFEAASENVLWFDLVYGSLWFLTGYFLWQYGTRCVHLGPLIPYAIMWSILGFWGLLGATLSEHEPAGRTPTLMDAPIYVAHWMSVQFALLCLFWLLLFSPERFPSRTRTIVGGFLFAIYLAIAFGGFL